jgi:phage pi2 protein 07
MRVAVCISGVARSGVGKQDYNQNFGRDIKNLRRNFPEADFFIGTWEPHLKQAQAHFPKEQIWSFPMPKAHYHPYLDMSKEYMVSDKMREFSNIYRAKKSLHERTRWQAHQILCHANMVKRVREECGDYDVFVRSRFDTFTYTHATFAPYVRDAFKNKTAIGFGVLKPDWPKFNVAHELLPTEEHQDDGGKSVYNNLQKYLFDALIIHNGQNIDPENIFVLHNQKKLCPAEFGWYQTLSQPYGDNHRCISGLANANRCVLEEFLKEATK